MGELQVRLVQRAVEIAGSPGQLATQLRTEEHAVRLWMNDRATIPARVFHQLVDLVLQDDVARAAQDRRARPREELQPVESRV